MAKANGSLRGKAGSAGANNPSAASSSANLTPTPANNNSVLSGPRFGVPPRIIGEPVRFYRRTILEWFSIVVGVLVGISYVVFVPFPSDLLLKVVLAVLMAVVIWGYVGFPTRAGKTTLEWSIIYLASLYSNIPRHTRARDSFGGSGSGSGATTTNRYASAASLSASYLQEQQNQQQNQGQSQVQAQAQAQRSQGH